MTEKAPYLEFLVLVDLNDVMGVPVDSAGKMGGSGPDVMFSTKEIVRQLISCQTLYVICMTVPAE